MKEYSSTRYEHESRKGGKARRVEKSLSQETCLERYHRPLRRREKGFSSFPLFG
jgi:hypothetical protein